MSLSTTLTDGVLFIQFRTLRKWTFNFERQGKVVITKDLFRHQKPEIPQT